MAYVQLVTFELCGEEYGIEIDSINGIIKSKSYKVVKIPNSPKFVEGIINIRGKVNPVFNLKKKFQFKDVDIIEDSKIIIVNSNKDSTIGFIVDEVTDIFKLNESDIDPVPAGISGKDKGNYIKGIGKVDGKVIIILDLINVLSNDEISQVESISSMSAT